MRSYMLMSTSLLSFEKSAKTYYYAGVGYRADWPFPVPPL